MSSPVLRSLCCAASLLAAGACAPHTAVPPVPPVPTAATTATAAPIQLEQNDVRALAALLRMEDARTWDHALVERMLGDDTPEVRGRAAMAAGRLRDSRASPLLLRALGDPDADVRARAAFALGLVADSGAAAISALSVVALRDEPRVGREAITALGRTGSERARPAVDSLLLSPVTPLEPLQAAILAAQRLPRSATTTAALAQRTAHADPEVRWRAAWALARAPAPQGIAALVAAASDPDDRVRANALRGLRAAVADTAGQRAVALATLIAAAGDAHPHVRINALRNLPAYGEQARTTPVLVARLREEDVNVAVAAAQALGEAADPSSAAALGAAATDPAGADALRATALAAWMRVDAGAAAGVAAGWADSTRWILRYHAVRALSAAPWPTAASILERVSRDPHPVVAAEALNAMVAATEAAASPASRTPPPAGARRVLLERLGAADPLVRAAAARGLGREGGVTDMDLLLEAYAAARADRLRDARIAVVEALGRLAAGDAPVARAFYLRFGDRAPDDPVLHRAVAEHIGPPPASWGEPRAAPEPRPLGFYEDVVRRLVAPVLAGAEPPAVAITTRHGDITVELAAADAPLTVLNFLSLVERDFYDGTRWHRVVPNFVIQAGDPRGDGAGGPGHAIRDEINERRYLRGTLGMALSGPDTGGSQFFITHSPQPHLDGGYTVFGRVLSGMEAVDAVTQDEPILGFRRIR